MKSCSTCAEEKALTEFHRWAQAPDGRKPQCKECACREGRRWYQENAEQRRLVDRADYWANVNERRKRVREYRAAHLEADLARQRVWRESHRDYLRTAARTYAQANPAKRRAAVRAFKRKHPEKYRAYEAKRRAKTAGSPLVEIVAKLIEQPCAYCGGTENIEIDHIIPLARGGSHEPDNLAPACRFCNRSKGAKLLAEWLGVAV